jgi:hypothetical protein
MKMNGKGRGEFWNRGFGSFHRIQEHALRSLIFPSVSSVVNFRVT